jgi:glycosyltransferase involved in cell wall biosynthesis
MHIPEAGGPPQHLHPWLEAAARTASVEVALPGPGSAERLYASLGTTHVLPYRAAVLPTGPRDAARLARAFVRDVRMFTDLLEARTPDLVLLATTTLPAVLVAARRVDVPVVAYAAEIYDSAGTRPVKAVAAFATRRLTQESASAIVCCSTAVARQYTGASTISPGIWPADVADRAASRRELGVVGAEPCLAVVGNIAHGRGQADLIRALPIIRRTFPRMHCLISGATLERRADQAYRATLERLVDELGVREAVTFTGFVDPVAKVYAAADIVVNPARVSEGLGRVALEALAAGRPVVSTHVGAVPEVLRDGEDALLVPPAQPAAIVDAVVALWSDQELRGRLVEAGRTRVLAEFGKEQATRRFLSVLDDVLAAHARRAAPTPSLRRSGLRATRRHARRLGRSTSA